MHKLFKHTATILASLFLAACATQPVPTSQARAVPDERIHDKSITTPKEGMGRVIIKRDTGFGGSACNTRIFADGKLSSEIAPGEKVVFYMSAGRHIISAQPKNPCGGGMAEAEANVSIDNPLVFRVGYGTGGDFGLYPTAF